MQNTGGVWARPRRPGHFCYAAIEAPMGSKCETQGELDLPRRFGRKNPPERRRIIGDSLRQIEIRAVKQIEGFGVEREAEALADREAAGERQIECEQPWSLKNITARRTELVGR